MPHSSHVSPEAATSLPPRPCPGYHAHTVKLRQRFVRFLASQPRAAVATDTVLRDFSRSLLLIADAESLHGSVAARLQELFGADRLAILMLPRDRSSFTLAYASGIDQQALSALHVDRRGPLAQWLEVNESSLVLARDCGAVESLEPDLRQLLLRLRIAVCTPLMSLNRLSGMILLGSGDLKWELTQAELDLLGSLAAQAGLAFENAFLYQEQRDRLRRLYTAERLAAVGQLAATVAHEIRNPLTAIRSTIQYISSDYAESTPKKKLVDELIAEVDRIDRILTGLLTLTRSGEPQLCRTDAVELVEQSLMLIAAQAENQGVRIERQWKEGPFPIMVDPSQLKQVCLNVLLNALQAMPGGGALSVGIGPTIGPSGNRCVHLRVSDSGSGISSDDLERIFDPFFTTRKDGTGLGLSISHGIVKRHDGEIDVRSELGKGTIVSIRLPLAP